MPRRRSSFGRSSRSSKRTSTTKAPQSSTQSKPTTSKSGGMFSGFMGTMMQGMAFGAGSEVAHQAVRGVMGSGNSHTQQQAPPQETQTQSRGKISFLF